MHQDSPVPPGPPDFSYRKHHCSPSRVHRLVMFSNLYLSRICKDKTLFQLGVKFPHCLEKVESVVSRWESDHLSLFSTCSETHYGTKKYLQSVRGSCLHGFSLRVPLRHTWGRNVIHVHVFFGPSSFMSILDLHKVKKIYLASPQDQECSGDTSTLKTLMTCCLLHECVEREQHWCLFPIV